MALWGGLKILCPVSLQPSAGAGGTQSLPHFPRGLRGPFPPAGPLLLRRLDERFGLSTLIGRHLTDPRTGRSCQFPVGDLFRQSVYSRLAGYDDTNDAERLAEDSTFRMLVSGERRSGTARDSLASILPGAARGGPSSHAAADPIYRQPGESGSRRARGTREVILEASRGTNGASGHLVSRILLPTAVVTATGFETVRSHSHERRPPLWVRNEQARSLDNTKPR